MDRTIRVLAAVVVALVAAGVLALDPPHDVSENPALCQGCHLLHNSLGSGLTKKDTNANLCDSCHGQISDPDGKHFGFPWAPATNPQAVPGTSGYSHRWDASVTSRGANAPTDANMAAHLDGTNIMCSTCHDQHNNELGANSGAQHVGGKTGVGTASVSVGTQWRPNGPAIAGTGEMKLVAVTATAAAKTYRVRVLSKTSTQITYDVSHDGGISWFAGGSVAPGGTTPAVVNLDDGTNVQVSFPSTLSLYLQNDYWNFWITYPLLQMSNADGGMCLQCHQSRNMRWQDVEGGNAATPPIPGGTKSVVLGTTVFSHPVSQALNANSKNYDRTTTTMLDVTGEAQATSTDTNKTNDLALGSGGTVTCMSCHHPHNADSNSLSVDPR